MLAAPVAQAHDRLNARRKLVRALATESPEGLAAWLDAHALDGDDLVWLHRQGLITFGLYRIQQAGLVDRLPEPVAARWQGIVDQMTVLTATQDWEIERILAALVAAGIDFIWLKGAALAYAVYPNPICRGRGDLDLWIQVERIAGAAAVLHDLGYGTSAKADRPDALAALVGGEQRLEGESPLLDLIELQWPALRGEWVRNAAAVDHAAIWRRRVPIALPGLAGWIMAPEDTLIHLCFHQAINHQFGTPWVRNLLDVHRVIATYRLDWEKVVACAVEWRLATIMWTVLTLAQRLLGAAVPEATLQGLAPSRWRRALIDRLHLEEGILAMASGGYGYRRFVIQMAMIDRPRDGLRLLARGLLPEASWLEARYADEPRLPLWRLRLTHLWRLATTARV